MAINLFRNTKMYISTVKGLVEGTTAFSNLNTWEVPVLDGYTFSQDVETQNITLSEAACTPTRGQKIFNTALNPVEVTFPTYMKPYKDTTNTNAVEKILWEAFVGAGPVDTNAVPGNPSMNITFAESNIHELLKINIIFVMDNTAYMIEDVGINSLDVDFAIDAIAMLSWAGQGAKITNLAQPISGSWVAGTDYMAEPTGAAAPQFIKNKLSQVEVYEDTKTAFNGFQVVNYGGTLVSATATTIAAGDYDFAVSVDGLADEIVTVSLLLNDTVGTIITAIDTELGTLTGLNFATCTIENGNIKIQSDDTDSAGYGAAANSIVVSEDGITNSGLFTALGAAYLINNRSTYLGIANAQASLDVGQQYLIPITGGSMTLTNNVTYLTPEELGKVNQPIPGGFTGTREFGGTLTAYLNTGANRTGGLLDALTTTSALQQSTNRFYINVAVGGCAASPKVEFTIPSAHLVIPTTNVEDVISTEIGFTAIGTDLNLADEISVTYTATL